MKCTDIHAPHRMNPNNTNLMTLSLVPLLFKFPLVSLTSILSFMTSSPKFKQFGLIIYIHVCLFFSVTDSSCFLVQCCKHYDK